MAAMQLWPHSSTCSARQLGTSLMPGQTECAAVTRSSRTRDWLRHHSEMVPAAVNFWQLHANVRAEAAKFVLPTMFCAVFHVCPGIILISSVGQSYWLKYPYLRRRRGSQLSNRMPAMVIATACGASRWCGASSFTLGCLSRRHSVSSVHTPATVTATACGASRWCSASSVSCTRSSRSCACSSGSPSQLAVDRSQPRRSRLVSAVNGSRLMRVGSLQNIKHDDALYLSPTASVKWVAAAQVQAGQHCERYHADARRLPANDQHSSSVEIIQDLRPNSGSIKVCKQRVQTILPGGIGRHSGAPWHVRKTAGAWRVSGSWCNQIVDLLATAYWRAITSPSPQAGQRRFDFEAPHMRQQLRQLFQAQIVVHAAYVGAADVFQRRVGRRLQLL